MASKYWIKLYHEILDDPKMGMLPDNVWRRCIEIFLLAGELETEGQLPSTSEIAWRLRQQPEQLQVELERLAEVGIVEANETGWFVCKFEKRQGAVDGAERVKRYRERKRKEEYYGNDTDNVTSNDTVTHRYTDTDIDIDTDIEREESTESSLSEWEQLLYSIAGVCLIDMSVSSKNSKDKLYTATRQLTDAGVCAAEVQQFGEWWRAKDWRGRKGEPPTPMQLLDTWGKFKSETVRIRGDPAPIELQPVYNDKGEVVGTL